MQTFLKHSIFEVNILKTQYSSCEVNIPKTDQLFSL